LVILLAERVRGAVLIPFLLGALLLEEIAFSSKLLNLKLEIGDIFLKQGALGTGGNGHGNSSAQGEEGRWLKLLRGCISRCVQFRRHLNSRHENT
jgi:hypothetical protein